MEQAGLPGYEVSNHARPGDESRHNLTYWRYGNYIGIGPGAHGRITSAGKTVATRRHRAPATWLDAVGESGHGTQDSVPVSDEDRLAEILMMGLRLREGVTRRQFETLAGVKFEDALAADRLAPLVEERLIELDDAGLRASAAGRQRLDSVLAYLLA
jgi:oxygen-independent coproporphyrinogen-3 oxidase